MTTPASKVFSLRYIQWLCLVFAAGLPSHAAGHAAEADVTIKRDNYGVPHIYAKNVRSLFYGYGYAVAEDRLYQMEMVKRSAQGTVAEVLGADYVVVDRASRADLDPASLHRQLATLTPADRDIFEGYAAGFNARIREVLAQRQALMPKEFVDAGFEPRYWTAYDVASVWVGLILNRFFSGNMEMANLNLLASLKAAKGDELGTRIYRQLRWSDDPTAPTIDANVAVTMPPQPATAKAGSIPVNYLRDVSPPAALDYQAVALARLGPAAAAGMPTASNAWVVAPRKSAGGNTVLYNGPQQGWFSPSIIYSVGLHGAGYDVTGSTPVGLPAIFFGTNGKIAWGSTVGGLDTNDLYQEQLDPDDQHRYRYQGQWRNMTLREETLRVKNGADIALQIYATVHGEVQSWDMAKHTAYTLKRGWRGHEVEALLGWIHVSRAGNWKQFLAQAQRVAASITWFYADKGGNIGYAGLGLLPRRPATQQIQFPANGDGSMEWQGRLPFSANPKQLNPAQAYLVSWNNKTMPGLTADGADYSYVDRVNELSAQLAAQPRLSKDAIWNIDRRAATADLNHRYFGAYLRQAVAGLPADDRVRQAAQLVADWDGQLVDDGQGAYRSSAAVAIFHAWLPLMLQELLQPDLPKDVYDKYAATGYLPALSPLSAKPGAGAKQLWYALQRGRGGAPFAYDFLHGRDADQLIRATLGQALTTLAAQQGPDQRSWRVPVVPMQFAAVSSIGVPWSSAAGAHVVAPYRNRGSVSVLVTLGRDGVSMCSAAAPGQSAFINAEGRPDQHYADQLPLFETFSCKEDHLTPSQVDAHLERVIMPSR